MAQPIVLQDSFTRMIQDVARDQLPGDAAWYMQDLIPSLGSSGTSFLGGKLIRRGGYAYASEDISTDLTGATKIAAMGIFNGTLYFTATNNKFGTCTIPGDSTNNVTQIATTSVQSLQPYVEFAGKLIIPADDGSTAPKYYDGAFGNLAGSPPAGKYAVAWNDRLVLGGTTALPRRTYFSAVGDPTTWDTTSAWLDANRNITGYATLPNCLLIFSDNQTARVRGRIPPPGSPDMAMEDPIFNVGCTYTASIAVNGPYCVFANEEGVFLTNGTTVPQDLTLLCGIKSFWRHHLASRHVPGTGTPTFVEQVRGGFFQQYYVAIIRSARDGANYAVLFDLATYSAFVFSNIGGDDTASIVMTPQIGDDLYFGDLKRVVAFSTMFTAQNKTDADTAAVAPILETRYFLDPKTFKKRWKTLYLDRILTDAATDNPTLAVSYLTDPSSSTYTSLATLTENTAIGWDKIPVRFAARGMAFKLAQTNASGDTRINAILADVHAREGGRL
jgi:hypothetical protein